MTADLVNLRQVRKRRARAEADSTAASHRAAHGTSGAARRLLRHERDAADRHLDGHRLDAGEKPDGPREA